MNHDKSEQKILIPGCSGTYLLFLTVNNDFQTKIGSLGIMEFKSGIYVYIGSALGSGGLRGRINRHLSDEKKIFWHIDYFLKDSNVLVSALAWIESSEKLECQIINSIMNNESNMLILIPKFGSSDSKCKSHLIHTDFSDIKQLIMRLSKLSDYNFNYKLIS